MNNKNTIRHLACVLAASFLSADLGAQASLFVDGGKTKSKPYNVVLLMADDLGYGDVGFNGNKKIITPHLDQMARSGITFDHFYAASCLCTPTPAACVTPKPPMPRF